MSGQARDYIARPRRVVEEARRAECPTIEGALEAVRSSERGALLRRLLTLELHARRARSESPVVDDYLGRFPAEGPLIRELIQERTDAPRPQIVTDETGGAFDPTPTTGLETTLDGHGFAAAETRTFALENRGVETLADSPPPPGVTPRRIGRFVVQRLLGEGGFGKVYLAWDERLCRDVAIKVPRAGTFVSEAQAERFLHEAKLAAALKHPWIVTVHDASRDESGTPFVVMEYVPGQPLSERLKVVGSDYRRLAALLLDVAEALHYAHERGLVHRDLKPANLLIDDQGRAHIADFGLAVQQSVLSAGGRDGEVVGTPHYMAPEQVRGESHRLDGRTDVWSLGVVGYQLLTGRLPFTGRRREVFQAISHAEPRSPRRFAPAIPVELERICLKCLARNAGRQRYATAHELAADLRHWLASAESDAAVAGAIPALIEGATSCQNSGLWRERVRVVPKGLRSFDAADTNFFLALLPGPFDRDGLPACLRFWKTRVEAVDPGETFPVGLLYGPSGCGKSSLVRRPA